MRAPAWLTARPVAHRGLHDRARGVVENMPGAMAAAVAGNFTIEVDLQLSADGEAMVHHDDELGRLTHGAGSLRSHTAAELQQVTFKDTAERMMTLGDLDKVVRVVQLGGFVNSTPDFIDAPKVINGASDLMVAAFGDKGRHARAAVGVASLPADCAVEVDGVFEVA